MRFTDSMNQRIGWPTLALSWLGMVIALVVFAAAAGHGALAALPRALRDTLFGVLPWALFRAWEAHRDPEDRGWHRWDLVVLVASTLISWIIALIVLAVAVFHRARGEVSVVGAPARQRKAKRSQAEPDPGVRAIQLGEAHNRPFYAQSHVLLVGPTGCGKTWTGIVPAIYAWDRTAPVLAISTKADLAGPLAEIRSRTQPVFGWDPSGKGIFNGIPGLEPVTFNLVNEINVPDDAVYLADEIVGAVDMSNVTGGNYWNTQGGMMLAALLWAARIDGHDLGWVLDQAFGGPDTWAVIAKAPGMEHAPALTDSLWNLVDAARGHGDKRADSVAGTVQTALASYRLQSVRTAWARPLTMAEWVGRGGCLFVASPADQADTLAPIIVGAVSAAIAAQRYAQHPAVLVAIDEIANVCPLPRLGAWLTELRSWGVTLLGAQQAWSQMSRWGKEQGVIEHAWPTLALFPGVSDHRLLDEISVAGGENTYGPTPKREIPHADVVGKLKPGQARIITGRTPAEIVKLSPVRELMQR